ncbi:DUF4381 family protein [Stenotrophomonas sp. HITSZ_GD]|uniref:DUF4381 family protein n=1 Tax=Stenotrophomonas sp. HITSZ_GD TaxID=3037248 RepID=UPI00240E3CD0|nr:DUF4381 family protein [Stenotrophomonas sp. HITSZ_GD]MDG2526795.1 DUF4381 family protein [Stenotrophomonas sp. HITSZ_GD]
MSPAELPLRDVHLPPPPSWWPPAAGWWWVGLGVLAVLAVIAALLYRRRARRRRWARLFDTDTAGQSSAARVAAMSVLLRRAARRLDPAADTLQGEAWLRWLDGRKRQDFSQGPGRLLLDGGFRPRIEDAEFAALLPLARRRFLQLMAGRR